MPHFTYCNNCCTFGLVKSLFFSCIVYCFRNLHPFSTGTHCMRLDSKTLKNLEVFKNQVSNLDYYIATWPTVTDLALYVWDRRHVWDVFCLTVQATSANLNIQSSRRLKQSKCIREPSWSRQTECMCNTIYTNTFTRTQTKALTDIFIP